MFERFTKQARQIATGAQEEARKHGHGHIGTEHLLLAMLTAPDTLAGRTLIRHGLGYDAVSEAVRRHLKQDDDLDAELLSEIGIDLDAVREKVEAAFGPGALDRPPSRGRRSMLGHVPFTGRAKKVLELALREAIALKHNHIGDGHVLLGLIRERDGLGARMIAEAGVDLAGLRREIVDELG
jgi:ATP-dependent Clp protease ATP-binding subunit ClpA